jgi:hypothetical protein
MVLQLCSANYVVNRNKKSLHLEEADWSNIEAAFMPGRFCLPLPSFPYRRRELWLFGAVQ